ncbi:MAG TPA: hypothetical protein VMV77_09660 [Bacteroidales bacterium]|nr:hypothetical protein [Bacteroidales bacterium]
MRSGIFMLMALIIAAIVYSCTNGTGQTNNKRKIVENKILQQDDGTISLKMDKADCYSDMVNPASNTAEWNVVVSKSGRFNVWLSSATKDTNDLHYNNSVMLSIHDKRLEAHPECDKVIHNSKEVTYPYFRADSFMGSLYIQDTGLYSIQVISDKILPKNYKNVESSVVENTKLISVFLTPTTR